MRSWTALAAGRDWSTRPAMSCGIPALTRLREAGMALEAVQAQAGHLSIEPTRICLHLTNDWPAGEYRRAADAAQNALRYLARWMVTEAGLRAVGDIRRDHIEDFKVWLAARPRAGGQVITAETHRQRMRTVRQFFERIIEWDESGPMPRPATR